MVTLYTTHCPKCFVLERKLEQAGIPFEKNTDVDKMTEMGFTSAPMLHILGQEPMDFNAAVRWLSKQVE